MIISVEKYRKIRDFVSLNLMRIITISVSLLFFFILITLIYRSNFIFQTTSIIDILFSDIWNPEKGYFGLYAIIIGTILVTGISLIIAVPISLLSAVYIVEYANIKIRKIIKPFLDVLAGVPSVVYGLCSFLILVPLVKDHIAPFFGVESTGLCVFTASITLSIMVFPIIISLCIESFSSIPTELRESSLSIGATKWETIKKVTFRAAAPSILSAILLGFGRAFGETIAVNMVVGGIPKIPTSLFDSGQTMASLIASAYGEMMSVPLYDSALMFVALTLFVIVLLFNILGMLILRRAKKRWKI